jgi:hypothetical protein
MNKLLQWATGHLLYFFGISAGGLKQLSRAIGQQAGPGPTRPLDTWFSDLTFEESLCWAFEIDEGDLEELYWRLSFYELIGRVKLKFGELNARMLCQFTAFAEVVNGVFGGDKQRRKRTTGQGRVQRPGRRAFVRGGARNINAALTFG